MGKVKSDKSDTAYRALKQVKSAYVMGFFAGGLTLVLGLIYLLFPDSPLTTDVPNWFIFVNAFIVIILSILLAVKKSRVCAILLFSYTCISQIALILINRNTAMAVAVVWIVIFGVSYLYGIMGAFTYQRLKKNGLIK